MGAVKKINANQLTVFHRNWCADNCGTLYGVLPTFQINVDASEELCFDVTALITSGHFTLFFSACMQLHVPTHFIVYKCKVNLVSTCVSILYVFLAAQFMVMKLVILKLLTYTTKLL